MAAVSDPAPNFPDSVAGKATKPPFSIARHVGCRDWHGRGPHRVFGHPGDHAGSGRAHLQRALKLSSAQ